MQAGVHSSWRLIGDLDSILQYPSWDHVLLGAGCRFPCDKKPVVWVTVGRRCLQEAIQGGQPARHQVDVLGKDKKDNRNICLSSVI